MVFGRWAGGWLLVRQLVVAGVGCGVVCGAVSLGLSRGMVWMSGADGVLSEWSRAGSCWRLRWYWSSRAGVDPLVEVLEEQLRFRGYLSCCL